MTKETERVMILLEGAKENSRVYVMLYSLVYALCIGSEAEKALIEQCINGARPIEDFDSIVSKYAPILFEDY